MDNKKKKDILLYQWLFIAPFSALAAIGVLVIGIMTLLIFITAAKYVVASFMLESAQIFPALVLTVICLGVVAALVFSEILIVKKYIKSLREFLNEKNNVLKSNDSEK